MIDKVKNKVISNLREGNIELAKRVLELEAQVLELTSDSKFIRMVARLKEVLHD